MITLRQITLLLLLIAAISYKLIATDPSGSTESLDKISRIDEGAEKKAIQEAHAIVLKQLESLQKNDQPIADAGILTAWRYAHPSNRQATGPLSEV